MSFFFFFLILLRIFSVYSALGLTIELYHCRNGSVLEYHRLPWKEPDAPYLLEILYEDDNLVIV